MTISISVTPISIRNFHNKFLQMDKRLHTSFLSAHTQKYRIQHDGNGCWHLVPHLVHTFQLLYPCRNVKGLEKICTCSTIQDGMHPLTVRQSTTNHLISASRRYARQLLENGKKNSITNKLSFDDVFGAWTTTSIMVSDT